MRKTFAIIFSLLALIGVTGCKNKDALKFKEEYEGFNDKKNNYFEYRDLNIEEDNPIVYSTAEEIVEKIENKETFLVYFGDPECPWCRSVVEQMIKSANRNNVKKLYYVRFWDGFHNEQIRDVYELDSNNKPALKSEGTLAYTKLLKYLDNVLKEYTLKDKDGNVINVGEKRIFLPNIVAIKDGKAVKLITGKSEKQIEYNGELTDEIIKDEVESLDKFFSKYN